MKITHKVGKYSQYRQYSPKAQTSDLFVYAAF